MVGNLVHVLSFFLIVVIFFCYFQEYTVSDARKEDQIAVDKQILDVVRKNAEKKFLFGYLHATFSLKNRQYPHKMVF